MTLEKYIDLSTIQEHNKTYLKSLFRRYIEYCEKDLNFNDFKIIDNCPLDLNLDIYNPDNVIKFMRDKCNFKRTSTKKIRDIFLRAMRKCTRNPSLDYTIPLGANENPNIKHYISYEELKKFLVYLKEKGSIELLILFELLYKFGVRVGALSKLKVKDLSDEGILEFHEKNKKIVKRKLRPKLIEKLRNLIKFNFLNKDNFIFFPNLHPENDDIRAKLFSNMLAKYLKDSGCFAKKENETISSHMFRASHAINIFKKYGLDLASRELNHSNSNTTSQHYIKIEDRNLLYNEEEQLFDKEIDEILNGENNKLDKRKKTTKNCARKNSKNSNLSDNKIEINELDENDIELDNEDDSILDSLFDVNLDEDKSLNMTYNQKIKLNLKRKRTTNEVFDDINFNNNKAIMNYEEFIKENKIIFSELNIEKNININQKNIANSKGKFEKLLKSKNLNFSNESFKSNNQINLITKAYSFDDIKFYSRDTLMKIDEYLNLVNNFQINIFQFKKEKENIKIVSNVNLKEGTYVSEIIGMYCFRKTKSYAGENIKGFKEIFLFKCHDKNYDRFLKNLNYVNIGSIIAENRSGLNGNCEIIKYANINLEIKVGIITTKDIKAGETFILES